MMPKLFDDLFLLLRSLSRSRLLCHSIPFRLLRWLSVSSFRSLFLVNCTHTVPLRMVCDSQVFVHGCVCAPVEYIRSHKRLIKKPQLALTQKLKQTSTVSLRVFVSFCFRCRSKLLCFWFFYYFFRISFGSVNVTHSKILNFMHIHWMSIHQCEFYFSVLVNFYIFPLKFDSATNQLNHWKRIFFVWFFPRSSITISL